MSSFPEALTTILDDINLALDSPHLESEAPEATELQSLLLKIQKSLLDFQSGLCADPEWKILDVLKGSSIESPMPTVDIAKASGLGKTRKSVNKHLYALQSKGKLAKIAEANGTKPRWYLL